MYEKLDMTAAELRHSQKQRARARRQRKLYDKQKRG